MVDLTSGISLSLGVVLVIAAVALIFFSGKVFGLLKKLLVNTVLGLIVLFAINLLGSPFGLKMPLTVLTVLVTAIFGLAGVGVLLLLALAGIKV